MAIRLAVIQDPFNHATASSFFILSHAHNARVIHIFQKMKSLNLKLISTQLYYDVQYHNDFLKMEMHIFHTIKKPIHIHLVTDFIPLRGTFWLCNLLANNFRKLGIHILYNDMEKPP